jgi:thiosulfate dehydrogenase [quinone] large subunit
MQQRRREVLPTRPDASVRLSGTHRPPTYGALIVADWRATSWPIRILRAFLGGTFVFAGMQKLLDPNFLNPKGGDYIGTQLKGFSVGTPAGPLMHLLAQHAVLAGVGVALLETAIGVAVLIGVLLPLAVIGGLLVNLTLLLSATWHTHPFFLGSDSIFVVAWLVLLVDSWPRWTRTPVPARGGRVAWANGGVASDRRWLLQAVAVGAAAIVLDVMARALQGPASASGQLAQAGGLGSNSMSTQTTKTKQTHTQAPSAPSSQTQTQTQAPAAPTSSSSAPPAPNGTVLTTLSAMPVGRAIGFQDPSVGPAVLLRLANDEVLAYSRVCTHAGCLVGYNPSAQLLVCPCHGAEYDPAHGAQPVAGPTFQPLQKIKVVVDKATGDIILPN